MRRSGRPRAARLAPPPPLLPNICIRSPTTPQLGPFLTVGFPLVQLEPAFDQHRRTLAEVLAGHLRRAAPQRHVDERRFLDPLARLDSCGDRSRPSRYRSPPDRSGVPDFHVPRQVSHQDHAVETGHNCPLAQENRSICRSAQSTPATSWQCHPPGARQGRRDTPPGSSRGARTGATRVDRRPMGYSSASSASTSVGSTQRSAGPPAALPRIQSSRPGWGSRGRFLHRRPSDGLAAGVGDQRLHQARIDA